MRNLFLLLLIFIYNLLSSQIVELKNKKLIRYYETINKAEISIVKDHLEKAKISYAEAFSIVKNPHAKDLYNSMKVLLNLKDYSNAYKKYQKLKCLQYNFDETFFKSNFPEGIKYKNSSCEIQLNFAYKKELDSLFKIDQYYRNLSNGNYEKYKNEITKSDSIASAGLLKLINKKGFPNEYDLGLASANKRFFQNFCFIIWHQLKKNLYSSQKVNFTAKINVALNTGKINPENAAFLLDLLNGKNDYSSMHFDINQFITDNGSNDPIYEQIKNKTAIIDCCYVTYAFFHEKRPEKMKKMINEIDDRRKKIGLCLLDDDLKKKIFSLNNDVYMLKEIVIEGHQFDKKNDSDFLKNQMFKIK